MNEQQVLQITADTGISWEDMKWLVAVILVPLLWKAWDWASKMAERMRNVEKGLSIIMDRDARTGRFKRKEEEK